MTDNNMTFLLGLTGGIASGKSTVSAYFAAHDIPIIDADKVAREVMETDELAVAEIKETFGPEVILENGEVDRAKLGQIIFGNDEKRYQLNNIVHPAIQKRIKEKVDELKVAKEPLVIMDIPLLLEGEYAKTVDEVMVIHVDQKTQINRLLKRNVELSYQDALDRINAQMSLAKKAEQADVVIDNSGSRAETYQQVEAWLQQHLTKQGIKI